MKATQVHAVQIMKVNDICNHRKICPNIIRKHNNLAVIGQLVPEETKSELKKLCDYFYLYI